MLYGLLNGQEEINNVYFQMTTHTLKNIEKIQNLYTKQHAHDLASSKWV